MRTTLAILALMTLTACDFGNRADILAEQDDRQYRAAMDDYQAGRLDAAIAGFEKAVKGDPSNASARFQLACLLQDVRKDFVGAYCGYREYLMQQPNSDKAALAYSRQMICEREVARSLSSKYGLNSTEALSTELAAVRRELKSAEKRVAAAEKGLGESQSRVRALSAEREKLLGVIKGIDAAPDDVADSGVPSVTEAKNLLEEEDDEISEQSSLLPVRSPEHPPRMQQEVVVKDEKPAPADPPHPVTYLVEDGDTLYGIAKRFYGNISAWKRIRDANKTIISMDNRLKAGDTLVLP